VSTIDDVKAALDIVEVVRGYVPALQRAGRSFKAPCPFHSERTPSFIVDPERRTWHCFGACATGGDVIEFVRRVEGLDFREALRRCAERAGVELRPPTAREQRAREEHERLLRANEAAALFFQAALRGPAGAAALAYAQQRGLDAAALDTWQLGYAPGEWRALVDYLLARGFTEGDLVAAGLATSGDRGAYDRFRDRLIFPTRDARGRLVGFGARALQPDQEPKYLNTPQTPLFDKSATLYGLDRAGPEARRAGRLVVVEGYMDVIGCHQAGIANVVASMGTSITEKQMALAQRYTANIVLMLDADSAGSAATLRGVEVAAGAAPTGSTPTIDWRGLVSYQDVLQADIRIVALPAGDDPDSLARSDPARLRALLDAAPPVAEHLFEAAAAAIDPRDPRSRSRAVELLAPTVAATADPVLRAHYVGRLARLGQVDEQTVLALLARRTAGGRGSRPAAVPPTTAVARGARAAPAVPDGEAQLLLLLLLRTDTVTVGRALSPDVFEDSANRRLFEAWCALGEEYAARRDELDEELRARDGELRAWAGGTWDPAGWDAGQAEAGLAQIAARLRQRRAQARVRPAALAQAEEVLGARRRGEPVLEFAARAAVRSARAAGLPDASGATGPQEAPLDALSDAARLGAEFVELAARQRALRTRASDHNEQYDSASADSALTDPAPADPSAADGGGPAATEWRQA
jgi:DNA primase